MKSLLQRRSALAWLAAVAAGTAGLAHAGAYDDFLRAIARDDAATVASLLRRGFDPNARDPKGQPALILALREEARQVAEVLIAAKGLKVEERNAKDESALMMAAPNSPTWRCSQTNRTPRKIYSSANGAAITMTRIVCQNAQLESISLTSGSLGIG